MSLEKEIDDLIEILNDDVSTIRSGPFGPMKVLCTQYPSIKFWKWKGYLNSGTSTHRMINKMIIDSSLEECLTSPSEYIREGKKVLVGQSEKYLTWVYSLEKLPRTSQV